MAARNITLSLPAELVRKARLAAAERDTSVSRLVAELIDALDDDADYQRVWSDEVAYMRSGNGLRVGDITWTRDELHER